jgi:hypothetical protein
VLALVDRVERPAALLRVARERTVVHGEPLLFVLSDHEGADLDTVGPLGTLREGERHAELEQLPLEREPGGAGQALVVITVEPERDVAATVVRDVVDRRREQRRERSLVVG